MSFLKEYVIVGKIHNTIISQESNEVFSLEGLDTLEYTVKQTNENILIPSEIRDFVEKIQNYKKGGKTDKFFRTAHPESLEFNPNILNGDTVSHIVGDKILFNTNNEKVIPFCSYKNMEGEYSAQYVLNAILDRDSKYYGKLYIITLPAGANIDWDNVVNRNTFSDKFLKFTSMFSFKYSLKKIAQTFGMIVDNIKK